MKTNSIAVSLSAGLVLAGLSVGTLNVAAASASTLPLAGNGVVGLSGLENIRWEEFKVEKLRHAYYLLEHTDRDYAGHRVEAMHAVKKAAEILGVELTGWHEPHEETQWQSDRRIREARNILESLQDETHGKEQAHVHRAVKELDKALEAH